MTVIVRKALILPDPVPGKTGWPWTDAPEPIPDMLPDGSPWPKISVVTPSYNQGQFIEETIRSVLLQGYPNLEFIIIDGGSTDNTLEIIKKYEPWLAYWVSESDRGQSNAINKGINKASGKILFWLNSDDLCLLGAFHRIAGVFVAHPELRLVCGQARIIDSNSKIIGELHSGFTNWVDLATNPHNSVRQISTFFARDIFDELGFLNETLHVAMDTELLVRLTKKYAPFVIDVYLAAYRQHPEAKTSTQLIKGYQEIDLVRPKILYTKEQIRSFKRNSANNWLSLAEKEVYKLSARNNCLLQAVKSQPGIILNKRLLSCIKRMYFQNRIS